MLPGELCSDESGGVVLRGFDCARAGEAAWSVVGGVGKLLGLADDTRN